LPLGDQQHETNSQDSLLCGLVVISRGVLFLLASEIKNTVEIWNAEDGPCPLGEKADTTRRSTQVWLLMTECISRSYVPATVISIIDWQKGVMWYLPSICMLE